MVNQEYFKMLEPKLEVTLDSIDNVETYGDEVLIKLIFDYSKYKLSNGIEIINSMKDPIYAMKAHSEQLGQVIKLPKNITRGDSPWITNMELNVGDIVWFKYSESVMSRKQINVKNDKYLLVNYYSCTFSKHRDKIVMLNGNIIVQPLIEKMHIVNKIITKDNNKSHDIIPEHEVLNKGLVKFVGSKNKRYRFVFNILGRSIIAKSEFTDNFNVDILPGMIIYYVSKMATKIQYETHVFDRNIPSALRVLQRKWIFAISKGEDIDMELVGNYVLVKVNPVVHNILIADSKSVRRTGTVISVGTSTDISDMVLNPGDEVFFESYKSVNEKGKEDIVNDIPSLYSFKKDNSLYVVVSQSYIVARRKNS